MNNTKKIITTALKIWLVALLLNVILLAFCIMATGPGLLNLVGNNAIEGVLLIFIEGLLFGVSFSWLFPLLLFFIIKFFIEKGLAGSQVFNWTLLACNLLATLSFLGFFFFFAGWYGFMGEWEMLLIFYAPVLISTTASVFI